MKTNLATEKTSGELIAPSKAEEIAILRDAIAKLGPLSYCGPWLAEQLSGIERDIRSDYFPQISLEATKTHCGEMLTQANDKADAILEAAQREASAVKSRANKDAEEIRETLARTINAAQRAMQNW